MSSIHDETPVRGKKKLIFGTGLVALIFIGIVFGEEGEEPTPAASPEAERVEEAVEEVAPPPSPPSSTMSEGEWAAELLDTTDKMSDLLSIYAEAMGAGATGEFTPSQVKELSRSFAEAVDSHLVFWRAASPPPRFEETTDLLIRSLDYNKQSGEQMILCIEDENSVACERAPQFMERGSEYTRRAQEAMLASS